MSTQTLEDLHTTFMAQAELTRKARMALEASTKSLRSNFKQAICDLEHEAGILQDQVKDLREARANQEPLALASHVDQLSTSHAERLDSLEATVMELEDSVATLQDSLPGPEAQD